MLPTVAELVARFLRSNGYTEVLIVSSACKCPRAYLRQTLATFINEAGLAKDVGSGNSDFTIEQILQEKKTFDTSLNFERLGLEDDNRRWRSLGEYQTVTIPVTPANATQPHQSQSLSNPHPGVTSLVLLHSV